jgi:integrase
VPLVCRTQISARLRRTPLCREQFARTIRTSELLFPGRIAQPLDASSLIKHWFQPTLKRTSLVGFTFHDLRHTFGSLLGDAGAPLAYVSEQMGHASTTVTAQVYMHNLRKNAGFVNRLDSQPVATQTQPEAFPIHQAADSSMVLDASQQTALPGTHAL